jgi:hypothetical protein
VASSSIAWLSARRLGVSSVLDARPTKRRDGSFRAVVPVHCLAYSFGWDGSETVPQGSSLVEIDLVEAPPDGTLLRLTHTGLPAVEQCTVTRKDGPITSNGWPRLQPSATRAQTLGMAALARSDRFFALHMAYAKLAKAAYEPLGFVL